MDLASISAGENDMDIDRVRFFRDAMAASAPIVFDLSPTAGFQQFSENLSFIGEAVAKDPKLPKKLVSLQVPVSQSHLDSCPEAELLLRRSLTPVKMVSPCGAAGPGQSPCSLWSGNLVEHLKRPYARGWATGGDPVGVGNKEETGSGVCS